MNDNQLARIEESYFSKMLDAYDASLIEGDKLADKIDDVANEYICDGSYLQEVADCDFYEFFDRLALMLKAKPKDRDAAFLEFKEFCVKQASDMTNVQTEAAYRLQQESFYSDDE